MEIPMWLSDEESNSVQEMWIQSPGPEDPLGKEMAIHFSILAWETYEQRSLVEYSPWGHKELDTILRLNYHQHYPSS